MQIRGQHKQTHYWNRSRWFGSKIFWSNIYDWLKDSVNLASEFMKQHLVYYVKIYICCFIYLKTKKLKQVHLLTHCKFLSFTKWKVKESVIFNLFYLSLFQFNLSKDSGICMVLRCCLCSLFYINLFFLQSSVLCMPFFILPYCNCVFSNKKCSYPSCDHYLMNHQGWDHYCPLSAGYNCTVLIVFCK